MSEQIEITIEGWAPVRRGPLRGYVTFVVPPGTRLHGWRVFERDGYQWAYPPGRPRIGADGAVVRHRDTGMVFFSPTVSFVNDAVRLRFERALIAALLKVFPHALDPLDPTDGDAT